MAMEMIITAIPNAMPVTAIPDTGFENLPAGDLDAIRLAIKNSRFTKTG